MCASLSEAACYPLIIFSFCVNGTFLVKISCRTRDTAAGGRRKIDWLRFFLFRSSRTNFMQVLWKHSREKFVWSLGVRLSGVSRVVTEIGFSCCQSGGFCWNGRQPGRLECWKVRSVIRGDVSLRKFIRRCWKMKTERSTQRFAFGSRSQPFWTGGTLQGA